MLYCHNCEYSSDDEREYSHTLTNNANGEEFFFCSWDCLVKSIAVVNQTPTLTEVIRFGVGEKRLPVVTYIEMPEDAGQGGV